MTRQELLEQAKKTRKTTLEDAIIPRMPSFFQNPAVNAVTILERSAMLHILQSELELDVKNLIKETGLPQLEAMVTDATDDFYDTPLMDFALDGLNETLDIILESGNEVEPEGKGPAPKEEPQPQSMEEYINQMRDEHNASIENDVPRNNALEPIETKAPESSKKDPASLRSSIEKVLVQAVEDEAFGKFYQFTKDAMKDENLTIDQVIARMKSSSNRARRVFESTVGPLLPESISTSDNIIARIEAELRKEEKQ